MSNLREQYNIALETGKWWTIQWYLEDQYYTDNSLSKEKVKNIFSKLGEIFDAGWFISQRDTALNTARTWLDNNKGIIKKDIWTLLNKKLFNSDKPSESYSMCSIINIRTAHPLFDKFIKPGTNSLNHLIELGQDLIDIEKAGFLSEKLINRLKEPTEYVGVRFELKILAHLIRRKCDIKLEPLSGIGKSKADFLITKGSEELIAELKTLQLSQASQVIKNISGAINSAIDDPFISSNISFWRSEPAYELKEKIKTKKGLNELEHSLPVLIKNIKNHIIDNINNKRWGDHIIPGLIKYTIYSKQGENGGIRGEYKELPSSINDEINKLIRNTVNGSIKQLSKKIPAILIVNIDISFLWDSEYIECMKYKLFQLWKKNMKKYEHLSALILVSKYSYNNNIIYSIEPFWNPNAKWDIKNYNLIKDILNLNGDKKDIMRELLANTTL